MMHRFFVDGPGLTPAQARQIATVLRLGPGEVVVLVRAGEELDYRLDRVTPRSVEGTVIARRAVENEPRVELTLALALLRGERNEEVVEAVTQLGVARIVPFRSARSVVREMSEAKRARWARIAREAAETSRRGRVPEITAALEWRELLGALPSPVIVAWEEERERTLAAALRDVRERISLVIGPEGGLTSDEIAFARERGATIVSLGRRTLRAETAAIAAVARAVAALDQ